MFLSTLGLGPDMSAALSFSREDRVPAALAFSQPRKAELLFPPSCMPQVAERVDLGHYK